MASVINTCERCGSAAPAGASVCPNCGAPMGAPMGGVDASVAGVPAATVRTAFSGLGSRPEDNLPPLGTQMPVGGGQPASEPAATPWQEALPPAPGGAQSPRPEQQVFSTPPSAPARRFPWPWIIGCCLAVVLLACLLAIGMGGWLLTNFSFT